MADEPEQQEAEPLTVTTVPKNQKIFHITHVNNLPGVVRDQVMWSDAACLAKGQACQNVGMSRIKQRRLMEIEVTCHRGTKVGEYVPFYFCPRSVMLYILYRGNHPDIDYQGGAGVDCASAGRPGRNGCVGRVQPRAVGFQQRQRRRVRHHVLL